MSFECVDHNKVWRILKELGIPDSFTCLLWNLCAGQEATVTTSLWTPDWFKIDTGVHQSCILLPCLFNLCRVGCFLVVQLTLCDPMDCSTPGLPIPKHLLKFVQVHVHCIRDAIQPLILWHLPLLLPSIFPSLRGFSNESAAFLMRWTKYQSFCIRCNNEYSGLIYLKTDWFDLLALQGVFRSLLQYHSLKASVLWCSAFFTIPSSHNHTWPLGRP